MATTNRFRWRKWKRVYTGQPDGWAPDPHNDLGYAGTGLNIIDIRGEESPHDYAFQDPQNTEAWVCVDEYAMVHDLTGYA